MLFIELIIQKAKLIGIVMIVIGILHLVLGRPRWQYYPLYIVGAIYFILIVLNYYQVLDLSPNISKWLIGIAILLIFISIVLLFAFPIEKLPIPSGEYKVGTRIYDLEDKSRNEIYSEDENANRKIKYQIWYPTDKIDGYNKVKWINDGVIVTRQLAKNMHLPAFMLDHTARINSNSYLDSPISNSLDMYPIVIISHGWKGFRELHTDYAEELASNGFITISIDHTYGSQAVKFEDDNIAYLDKDALPDFVSSTQYNINSNRLVTTYGEDVASVLDELVNLNNSDHFNNKLDLDKVGVIGHSTGGGGDVYISQKDIRIRALLGFDAWVNPLESKVLQQGLLIPTLFIRSEEWSTGPNNNALNDIIKNSENVTLMQMNKTKHVDFSMSYMYSPLTKYIGFTGSLEGRQSTEIQRDLIIKFFDNNLRESYNNNDNYLEEIVNKYDAIEIINMY